MTSRVSGRRRQVLPRPRPHNPCRVSHATGLASIRFRSPLLTESRLFSSPVGTEMFHFPTFPPHALRVQARVTPHDWCGVPPFGHPRINARLAAPRGLSQPPTSFIGSWCPGIHRVPLTTWPHKKPPRRPRKETTRRAYTNSASEFRRCSRPLCSSQRTTGHRPHAPAGPAPPTGGDGGSRNRTAPTEETTPRLPGRARSLRTQQRAYGPVL